ncbi:beta/gamma crystallin-related protein [Pendulispora rubella]|uniref:Beta/gamma crystallin-related protein n=2 Tax=Pendulispora rubella TaxID=2741070 RepID=A0ABZ2KUV0_9BACT
MNLTLKSILGLFLAAASLVTMACNIHLDDNDDTTVTLYTDASFRGTREQRTERDGKCANVPENVNDRVSSIACNGEITVYEHEDCRGDSRRFTCDVPNLHDFGWGDRISSIRF